MRTHTHTHAQFSNEVNDLREWPLVKVRGCFKSRHFEKSNRSFAKLPQFEKDETRR